MAISTDEQESFSQHVRFDENRGTSLSRRFLFGVYGLLAGDVALFLYLLPASARNLGVFIVYCIFSLAGWTVIGLPVVLMVPPRLLCRLPLPRRLLIGAVLGPLALFLVFVLLFVVQRASGADHTTFSLAHSDTLWPMSMLVSTISFVVYTALLRRRAAPKFLILQR
jgi:hypothetical protein